MKIVSDYSKLELKGNGHTQDSFSLAVQAAAGLLKKALDYEQVYCLSGNAFSPAIDRGENCTAWWHVQGWQGDKAMDTVARSFGLRAERLDFPPDELSPNDSQDVFDRKALAARKRSAAMISEKMDAGAVIITDGGWRVRTKEGFAPWCWWGVITTVSDDGDIRGVCLGANPGRDTGFRDRPMDYIGGTWAVFSDESAKMDEDIAPVVLQQAIDRINGTGPYTAEKRSVYGLAAMDAWIAQMETVPFCEACADAGPKGMAGCAVNNAQTTLTGAKVAASCLRRLAADQPGSVAPQLVAAAQCYDRIVELLNSATWKSYRDMLNDIGKQKAHAESVLKPVRDELEAAAEAMEQALAANTESV